MGVFWGIVGLVVGFVATAVLFFFVMGALGHSAAWSVSASGSR